MSLLIADKHKYRWVIFSVLALMYILVYFYRVSLAVVAGDITRDLSLTPQQLGALSGIMFYAYAVVQIPLGPMIDHLGGRSVICVCGILTAIGGILFSQSDSLASAMTARILIGVGTAAALMATLTIFSHWYSKAEFGRVSSFMVAVGNLGNLSATAPLALAVASFGWRNSFLAIGLVQIMATLLVFALVRNQPPKESNPTQTPETSPAKIGLLKAWEQVFGSRDFWLLGLLAFSWYGNYMSVQGLWGGPYLMNVVGLSRETTGNMLMLTSIGFIIGSIFIDTIARRVFRSYKKTMLIGQLILLLLMCCFLGSAESMPQILLSCLFFAIGLAVSSGIMIYPLIRSMFPVQIVGTALTSLNFFVLLGAAVTQQAMGLVIGSFSKETSGLLPQAFHKAFMFPVVCLLLTSILFMISKDYSDIKH